MSELTAENMGTIDGLKVQLSKQARAFLQYLKDNRFNGEIYSRESAPCLIEPFPRIDQKLIEGKHVAFYRKGISLMGYIVQNQHRFSDCMLFRSLFSGVVKTRNRSLRNSLERTIRRLFNQGLVSRFRTDRYQRRYFYYIPPKVET